MRWSCWSTPRACAPLTGTLIAFALLLPYLGWTLAAVVFLVFDVLIGLSLPTGPWGF